MAREWKEGTGMVGDEAREWRGESSPLPNKNV